MHVFHIVRFMHSDWERERAAEAICRGLLSVCRLGPSSHLVAEKRKNNNLTSIPFETPILRVQFLIVRIKSRDEIDLSSSSEEVHSLREDTSVELILYNINRHVRACCSQIPATLNTRFFFSLVAKNDRGKKSKGPVGFKWIIMGVQMESFFSISVSRSTNSIYHNSPCSPSYDVLEFQRQRAFLAADKMKWIFFLLFLPFFRAEMREYFPWY